MVLINGDQIISTKYKLELKYLIYLRRLFLKAKRKLPLKFGEIEQLYKIGFY
jgi:hypothetical protein